MSRKLNETLVKKLNRKYTPLSIVDLRFRGKDAVFKTDAEGNPVVLFIGQTLPNGKIKGERYSRVLKKGKAGEIIKDHWDLKGKAD